MAVMIDQSGPNPVLVSGGPKPSGSLKERIRKEKVTLADIPDARDRFAVPRTDHNGFPIVDLGSSQYGTLTVNNLIATDLSAVSAYTGSLTVNGALVISTGGNIHSGQTAYNVGAGYWLDAGPRFSLRDSVGNFVNIDLTGSTPLIVSSSALQAALSSLQVDDAGWSTTAVYGGISGLPTTLAGYGITDAQSLLPNASGMGQVLQRDNGGTPYFADKYDGQLNVGAVVTAAAQNFPSTSLVEFGKTLDMGQPPDGVGALFIAKFFLYCDTGNPNAQVQLQYSTDGGTTWTSADTLTYATSTVWQEITLFGLLTDVAFTGNFRLRLMVANQTGANNVGVRHAALFCYIAPNANFTIVAATLAATVPSTASGSCTATYPTTTCTATNSVAVTPSGGTPPYTYSWTKVSGTGTLSNSTSQTCTVTDNETTADGGVSHTTTINCTVTDSTSANVTTGNCVVTNTFYRVYSPISASVSTASGSCSSTVCGTSCTAHGTATANASGGNGSYTYSWSYVSGPGSITSGASSQTCTVSDTETPTNATPTVSTSTTVQCSVNDTRGTGATTAQGTVKLKFYCSGP